MKKTLFTSLLLLTTYYLLPTPIVHADTTLSVSPPVVEILLAPNKKVSQTFTLQTSGENLDITPELHLAIPSDSSGHMTIDPNPLNPSSLPITFSISDPIYHLPSTIYHLTIEAASTDLPQDIYLALVFQTNPAGAAERLDSRATQTTPSISALILVTINPTGVMPISLELKDFDPPYFHDSWLPLTLSPQLENKSGIMIRPQGKYEVVSPSGKTVLDLPLYPNLILGNSSRQVLGSDTNPAGLPRADDSRALTFTPTWSAIGPHRLRLTITTEGGTQITEVEKVVWIFPIRLIIIISVLFLIVLSIILVSRRQPPTHPLTNSPEKLTLNL